MKYSVVEFLELIMPYDLIRTEHIVEELNKRKKEELKRRCRDGRN